MSREWKDGERRGTPCPSYIDLIHWKPTRGVPNFQASFHPLVLLLALSILLPRKMSGSYSVRPPKPICWFGLLSVLTVAAMASLGVSRPSVSRLCVGDSKNTTCLARQADRVATVGRAA